MTDGNGEPLEIERKFLIRMPRAERLCRESTRRIEIRQVYLHRGAAEGSRRVRRSRTEGDERWYFTEKIHLTDRKRIEREREISPEEAQTLLLQADEKLHAIEKTRWCVPYAGHTLEIDIFPFWADRAFLEAELSAEDEELRLPDWVEVIREVTEDRRYTNLALAAEIPEETI